MTMKTQHGATMSHRMERLWRFIKEEREINLSDWSTDDCVERELEKLTAAAAELQKRLANNSGDKNLRDLADDLASIIGRRPKNRAMPGKPTAAGSTHEASPDYVDEAFRPAARRW